MNEEFPNQPRAPRRSGCVGPIFAFATVFALGAGVAGFASWQLGWLRHGAMPMMSANGPTLNPMGEAQINARIAELDRKLGAIETQAALAGGQAGRAEALLVSIATRRAIERGTPLGYLEGQLRTRFGEALPQVVNSVIAFGRAPITQDRLSAQLDVLAPQLTGPDETQSTWSKVRRDLSGLFILHSETRPAAPDPKLRLDHARLCLREGRIEDAIADVRLLPGAKAAQGWINDAQRYAAAMHALDALDTSALLEPKGLRDGQGRLIEQASPLAGPAQVPPKAETSQAAEPAPPATPQATPPAAKAP